MPAALAIVPPPAAINVKTPFAHRTVAIGGAFDHILRSVQQDASATTRAPSIAQGDPDGPLPALPDAVPAQPDDRMVAGAVISPSVSTRTPMPSQKTARAAKDTNGDQTVMQLPTVPAAVVAVPVAVDAKLPDAPVSFVAPARTEGDDALVTAPATIPPSDAGRAPSGPEGVLSPTGTDRQAKTEQAMPARVFVTPEERPQDAVPTLPTVAATLGPAYGTGASQAIGSQVGPATPGTASSAAPTDGPSPESIAAGQPSVTDIADSQANVAQVASMVGARSVIGRPDTPRAPTPPAPDDNALSSQDLSANATTPATATDIAASIVTDLITSGTLPAQTKALDTPSITADQTNSVPADSPPVAAGTPTHPAGPPWPLTAPEPTAPPQTEAKTSYAPSVQPAAITPVSSSAPEHKSAERPTDAKTSPLQQQIAPGMPLQQPAPPIESPVTPPAATVIPSHPPTSPAQQLAPALLLLSRTADGSQQMTVRLRPADLGMVQVRIATAVSGVTQIEITAEHPSTLQALQRDQPQLHRTLDDAGIPAAGRTVTFHVAPAVQTAAAAGGSPLPGSHTPSTTRSNTGTTDPDGSAGGDRGSYPARDRTPYPVSRRANPLPTTPQAAGKSSRIGLDITA